MSLTSKCFLSPLEPGLEVQQPEYPVQPTAEVCALYALRGGGIFTYLKGGSAVPVPLSKVLNS
jgi:hypothetical protein